MMRLMAQYWRHDGGVYEGQWKDDKGHIFGKVCGQRVE